MVPIGRMDTYNSGKVRYWCERKASASMEQAHRTELTDRTTFEAAPDMDEKGENIVIRDECHDFDFSDFSCGAPSASGSSGGNAPNPHVPGGDTMTLILNLNESLPM